MAPASTAAVTAHLKQVIYYHLDNFSYDNALFFAERLTTHDPRSSESAYLLSLSHFRLGDFHSAYEISKATASRNLGCAFVFAQTCLVTERFRDGILVLEKSRGLWSNKLGFGKHTATSRAQYPDAASVLNLLGKLYRAYDDKKKAIPCFEEALKLNPFMWDAFTALCDMGISVKTSNIFKMNESLLEATRQDQTAASSSEPKDSALFATGEPQQKRSARAAVLDPSDPFDPNRGLGVNETATNSLTSANTAENDFMSKINAAKSRMESIEPGPMREGMETPTAAALDNNSMRGLGYNPEPPQAPNRKVRNPGTTDTGMLDSLKFGTRFLKRPAKPQDRAQEDVMTDSHTTMLRAPTSALPGIERKRTVSGHPVQPRQQSEEPGIPQRRSARINHSKSVTTKSVAGTSAVGTTGNRELKKARPPQVSRIMRPNSSNAVGRAVSGNRKPVEENGMDIDHAEAPRVREISHQVASTRTGESNALKMEEALKYALDLLGIYGRGYALLAQYETRDALAVYKTLPRPHQESPWVLAQMAKALYEKASYTEAEQYYKKLRMVAPMRQEDMEIYSTILWFLRREVDLSFLAHELVDSSWHSPQAWCALGNAWSLARDHEQALRCFKRATQLNPKFAYAFTLQGHEHVSNEEYEKALTAYRQALAADRRHYNAYYGIGRVYEKLGNYDKAYTHFHSAMSINPNNAVLTCCVGTVLERQRQMVQALHYFTKASELAPEAAQTRYKKARTLMALNQIQAAQDELEQLKNMAPDEATVHFLLGKLYKMLNDKSSSVRHFTIALNLDPKASQQIKEAIESLEDDDSFDDSMIE